MLKQITPALVLDKHMIPCRDENEKRLLYAYLSKKRELAEHLSQIIYVLKQVLERSHLIVPRSGVNPIADCDIAYLLAREIYFGIISRLQVVTPKT